MQIPYFVFTSGEEGVSRLDWGVKFASPGLSLFGDAMKRNTEIDEAYRGICEAFSCSLSLERPKTSTHPGFLILPWRGAEVFLGYIFPYTDLSGRPNISLVGVIISFSQRSSFSSLSDFVRELSRQNPLEKIAKRGWGKEGQGERPDFLSLEKGKAPSSGDFEAFTLPQDISWPERNRGVLAVNGNKKDLHRKLGEPGGVGENAPPPVSVPPRKRKMWPWIAGVVLLCLVVAGGLYWYKQSKDGAGDTERFVVASPSPIVPTVTPTPVPDRSKEVARKIVDSLLHTRDPDRVQPESLENFVSLGYAREYGVSGDNYILKGIVGSLYQSPFTEKDITLKMEDDDKDIVFISRDSLKKHILEALRRVGEGGKFYSSATPRMFHISNVSDDIFNNFKKAITTLPVPLEGQSVSMDQIVADVASLLRKIGKGTPEQSFVWFFFFFGSDQGAYKVYLQEIGTEPLGVGQPLSEKMYIPSVFVRISKEDAESLLEERFSTTSDRPFIQTSLSHSGNIALDVKLIKKLEGSHANDYFKAFAQETVDKILQTSNIK